MITLTVDQPVRFPKTHFKTVKELFDLPYEEQLEQKLQEAKKTGKFTDF